MAATQTAARRVGKQVFEANNSRLHVELTGLSRTALPADLRRLCGKSKVEHVSNAVLDYRRFRSTGTGLLTFSRPEHAAVAHKALNGSVAGGKRVKTRLLSYLPELPRMRGQKGILQAAQRGAITGDGPSGGIAGSGRNVVLYGLPGKLSVGSLLDSLRGVKLAGAEYGKEVVVKLDTDRLASTSRFLVRTTSPSEAYRLVRKYHMQMFRPESKGDKHTMRAFVVW